MAAKQVGVERLISVCCTLLVARAMIVECQRMLRHVSDWLRPVVVMMYAVPVAGLMIQAFGTKKLRGHAYEVLAEMIKEEE